MRECKDCEPRVSEGHGETSPDRTTQQAVTRERRAVPRHAGKARATLIRDNDQMRAGIEGELYDVSRIGISVLVRTPPRMGEHVTIELENPIQRTQARVRALVRHIQPPFDGWYRVGCSPLNRLTFREVEGLRTQLPRRPRSQK